MGTSVSNKKMFKKYESLDINVIGPDIGDMACGEYGEGKMSSVKIFLIKLKII